MRISKFPAKKTGFTIMEALVSATILIVAVTGFLSAYVQSSDLTALNRSEDLAFNAAASKMEEISNSDIAQVMNYDGQTYPVTGLTPVAGQANPLSVEVEQIIGATDLYAVTVTVSWEQPISFRLITGQPAYRNMTRTLNTTLISK